MLDLYKKRNGVVSYVFLSLIACAIIILYAQTRMSKHPLSLHGLGPNRNFFDQGGFAIDSPPSIALLFQIRRDLTTASIWEKWFRDAYDWTRSQQLEDNDMSGPLADTSSVLRAFVNYSPAFREENVKEFMPPALRSRLIPAPVDCRPEHIAACHYRLLVEATTSMPEANYFILVSEDSVPLIPFREMYNALKSDRRIRTTLVHMRHGKSLPKTTPWKGEPREIVALRLNELAWLNNTSVQINNGQNCAPDECLSWLPVVQRYGDAIDDKFNPSACLDTLSCFMVDCWDDMKLCVDSGDLAAKYPYKWNHLKEEFLLSLLHNPNIWMLRRVGDNTTVGDKREKLDEYLARFFQSDHSGYTFVHHPSVKKPLPDRGSAQSIYDVIKLYRAKEIDGLDESLIS